MVYVVCSTEPEENEKVIEEFLDKHPDFRTDPIESSAIFPKSCITESGFFRTWPHMLSMDGFFAARLKRSL
jgi:16S rRNA (cytosine967-C5)-methyltransferase